MALPGTGGIYQELEVNMGKGHLQLFGATYAQLLVYQKLVAKPNSREEIGCVASPSLVEVIEFVKQNLTKS